MHSTTVHIDATLQWQLVRTARGAFLAVCEPLGLTLEADDEAEARSIIGEGLHHFFLDHFEEGTLERFLAMKGWRLLSPLPQRGEPSSVVRFDVPWSVDSSHAA